MPEIEVITITAGKQPDIDGAILMAQELLAEGSIADWRPVTEIDAVEVIPLDKPDRTFIKMLFVSQGYNTID